MSLYLPASLRWGPPAGIPAVAVPVVAPPPIIKAEPPGNDEKSPAAIVSTAMVSLGSRSRPTRSMRLALGETERVFSIATPISWRLPHVDNKVFRMNDRYLAATVTTSAVTNVYTALYFTVAGIGNITPLATLFDQYRIKKIEVLLLPACNAVSGAGAGTGVMHTVIDYDDATALTSEQAALSYENCLSSSSSDGHRREFVPHAAMAAYSGAFNSYANVASPWIDAVSTGVQHYGLKIVNTVATQASEINVYATLFTEWRNVR